jgi:hypothetical protein
MLAGITSAFKMSRGITSERCNTHRRSFCSLPASRPTPETYATVHAAARNHAWRIRDRNVGTSFGRSGAGQGTHFRLVFVFSRAKRTSSCNLSHRAIVWRRRLFGSTRSRSAKNMVVRQLWETGVKERESLCVRLTPTVRAPESVLRGSKGSRNCGVQLARALPSRDRQMLPEPSGQSDVAIE